MTSDRPARRAASPSETQTARIRAGAGGLAARVVAHPFRWAAVWVWRLSAPQPFLPASARDCHRPITSCCGEHHKHLEDRHRSLWPLSVRPSLGEPVLRRLVGAQPGTSAAGARTRARSTRLRLLDLGTLTRFPWGTAEDYFELQWPPVVWNI
ncbi:PREDICTED: uncharacterized protein LOC108519120 [Rhinopithecus bieti]|uniref:uncharacterized protein LOC108519120 n=1 Tax=Rhinopithecus bieti TaxID=61621 RepID=UPI00083BD061|nr:PREDICTED: uncharacterized protein LOC108519120 [Rhinopithecus bieti]